MENPTNIRIALVDDHPLILAGMQASLADYGGIEVAIAVTSAAELFEHLPQCPIDVAVLDIIMPGMSGIDAAQQLRQDYPEVAILMLSSESDPAVIEESVAVGIDGFVSKLSPTEEIVAAVESVAAHTTYFGADIALIIDGVTAAKACDDCDFTERELQIIAMSADGLQGKEIAERMQISPRTVETHKNNIFHKLGINNSVELVRYAMRHGIIKL